MKFVSSIIIPALCVAAASASAREDEKFTVQTDGGRTLVYGAGNDINDHNHYYDGPSAASAMEKGERN